MTTLVTGATGNTGRHVVRELVRRGEKVEALTRDAAAARALLGPEVDLVTGTHTAPSTLDDAWPGVDRLHVTVTAGLAEVGPELIDRAVAAGVRRITVVWGGGVGPVERAYNLTGPAALTTRERIAILAEAAGRPIEFARITHQQAVDRLLATGVSQADAEYVIGWYAESSPESYTVDPTVETLLGRPARTFTQWAAEHAHHFARPTA
ncbi:NAD(P)H-binding protein [Nocardia rhizosphaerae]|uniref:NAD(P)H-binding protein n=1 Tax=Nocardia rhizosphaerae TaxID=1691571 RepID=A0ABV8L1E9_9NOCA